MDLDKRVDMLSDEQVHSLEPLIDFLSEDPVMNYETGEFRIDSMPTKEALVINAYNSEFSKDKNYKKIVDKCAERILNVNTLHMLFHYSKDESFMAGHFLRKNLMIRKLMNSK